MEETTERFAKLYEFPVHQVLITKDYDSESESYKIAISTVINGIAFKYTADFKSAEKCDGSFKSYNKANAFTFLQNILNSKLTTSESGS